MQGAFNKIARALEWAIALIALPVIPAHADARNRLS
jgi:hypothetical protein